MERLSILGKVRRGYRIASGLNVEGVPGPGGIMLKDSFVRQKPFFEKQIPALRGTWTGTINVDIAPRQAKMISFDHQITCEWHPGIKETFGIIEGVEVIVKGQSFPGFIYYPLPSEIHTPRHHIIEVIAPKIEGLSYGDDIEIRVSGDKVAIEEKK